MGCNQSRHEQLDGDEDSWSPMVWHRPSPMVISEPVEKPIMVPPVERDVYGRPMEHKSYELNSSILRRGLQDMADYLIGIGVTVNAVSVGGAVSVLYLHSRDTTHDVDFFLANPRAAEHHALNEAAQHANRRLVGTLGDEWFNNLAQLRMGDETAQESLVAASVEQRAVAFERTSNRGGLRLYVGYWPYAIMCKLNRMRTDMRRPCDLDDAMVYMREYLRSENRHFLRATTVCEWGGEYGKEVTREVMEEIDDAYQKRFGYRPIEWDS